MYCRWSFFVPCCHNILSIVPLNYGQFAEIQYFCAPFAVAVLNAVLSSSTVFWIVFDVEEILCKINLSGVY